MSKPDRRRHHYHGDPSIYGAFTVTRPGSPKRMRLQDMDTDDLEEGQIMVHREDQSPMYAGVFWLVSGRGKGREPALVDRQGNVVLNLSVLPIGLGVQGVEVSSLNKDEVDVSGFLHNQIAIGRVRVDHLKNADGEPLGLPPAEVSRDRIAWRDWTWQVLDPARLKQLTEELAASESGRGLLASWDPKLRGSFEGRIYRRKGKFKDEIEADLDLLKTAKAYLRKAAEKVRRAVEGADGGDPPPSLVKRPVEAKGQAETKPAEARTHIDDCAPFFLAFVGGSASEEQTRDGLMGLTAEILRDAAKVVGTSVRGSKSDIVDGLIAYLIAHRDEPGDGVPAAGQTDSIPQE